MVAYDTLYRRSELISLDVEDIRSDDIDPKRGTTMTSILLRRSNIDPEDQGRWLPLSERASNDLAK